MSSTETQVY